MNIKDMENFYLVSSHKSFSMAARMIGVSQPTLSESIRRLENDLSAILFYRSKKGISLTPQGEIILKKVSALLNIKNEITSAADPRSLATSYRLGTHPIVAGYFLKNFLQVLNKTFPKTSVELKHGRSLEIQTLVQNGSVDFAIIVNPIKNPDLVIRKVCSDRICIWKTKSSKNFKSNQLIADLGLTQSQSLLRNWKKPPTQFISTSDFHTIGELTSAGLGYGMLPEKFVLQHKLKLERCFKNLYFDDELSLVYRPEFGKTPLERFLIDSLFQAIT